MLLGSFAVRCERACIDEWDLAFESRDRHHLQTLIDDLHPRLGVLEAR
jgi:hypothetical protein